MNEKVLYSESHLCTGMYTHKQLIFWVSALPRLLQLVVMLDGVGLQGPPIALSGPGAALHQLLEPLAGQHYGALLGSDSPLSKSCHE